MRVMVLAGVLAMLPLGGCVAGMAAGAVGAVARSARGEPVRNDGAQPQAVAACSTEASRYGAVKVIDIEQSRIDRITVWGTAGGDDAGRAPKKSFECKFGTKVTSFKLRPIPPR